MNPIRASPSSMMGTEARKKAEDMLVPGVARCVICESRFTMKSPSHKYDSRRCAYIAAKLVTPAGLAMGRAAAIKHYGALWDDPLRSLPRGKYKLLLREIMEFCDIQHSQFFSVHDLEEFLGYELAPKTLYLLSRKVKAVRKSGWKTLYDDGSTSVVWEFKEADL